MAGIPGLVQGGSLIHSLQLRNSWGLCPRSGSVFPFPWLSNPVKQPGRTKGQGLCLWLEGGLQFWPGELKASSSSGISLFIGCEAQEAQPSTRTPASGVWGEGRSLKLQAKLVPLVIACSLRPGVSLGSRPPGHRIQPGPHPDATAAHGPAPGSHLQARKRVRTAFSLLQHSQTGFLKRVQSRLGCPVQGHIECCVPL